MAERKREREDEEGLSSQSEDEPDSINEEEVEPEPKAAGADGDEEAEDDEDEEPEIDLSAFMSGLTPDKMLELFALAKENQKEMKKKKLEKEKQLVEDAKDEFIVLGKALAERSKLSKPFSCSFVLLFTPVTLIA